MGRTSLWTTVRFCMWVIIFHLQITSWPDHDNGQETQIECVLKFLHFSVKSMGQGYLSDISWFSQTLVSQVLKNGFSAVSFHTSMIIGICGYFLHLQTRIGQKEIHFLISYWMQSISFAIGMPSKQSRCACQSYNVPQCPITSKSWKLSSAGSRNHSSQFINLVIRFMSAHLLFKIPYDRNWQPGTHYVAMKAIPQLVVCLNGVLQTLNMPLWRSG
jgi:hypothetical protein